VRTFGGLLTIGYAGAAPGLVAGAVQINVKLPDVIPLAPGYPPGILPLTKTISGVSFPSGYVTIAVVD
jgi:uncharacterized protein (TIGR03437 family)